MEFDHKMGKLWYMSLHLFALDKSINRPKLWTESGKNTKLRLNINNERSRTEFWNTILYKLERLVRYVFLKLSAVEKNVKFLMCAFPPPSLFGLYFSLSVHVESGISHYRPKPYCLWSLTTEAHLNMIKSRTHCLWKLK